MSKGEYEKAFIESDYINVSLIYTDKKEKKIFRSLICFNPPFNRDVSTKVAKNHLNFIDQNFS